ncbi:MAG: sensor histidine kinase [Pseudobdellovibrio sp.]|nr:sensor histidine kinase [Pseudobdellovibrio sp.]
MASTNKTGLVLKIAIVLVLALSAILYKFNDYSRNDKTAAMQEQLRKVVLNIKTSVSGQLSQLKNNLSGYNTNISESSVNWVQLDPFFAIANAENNGGKLTVSQIVTRSNTPAERWNAAYLEGALKINKSKKRDGIIIQLFKDKSGAKFILVRFPTGDKNEIVLASTADYFQKYFDIDRGSRYKSLLITTEKILAGHTEGDYLATSSKEASLSPSKYVIESEEIVGTNLLAVSYVLKSKIVPPFAVPWSIVGLILGIGLVLIGLVYYNLDNIERRLERYKKQEREQIYKDTLQQAKSAGEASPETAGEAAARKQVSLENPSQVAAGEPTDEITKTAVPFVSETSRSDESRFEIQEPSEGDEPEYLSPPQSVADESAVAEKPESGIIDLLESSYKPEERLRRRNEAALNSVPEPEEISPEDFRIEPAGKILDEEVREALPPPVAENNPSFVTLDEEAIDLDEIEKALALDDFDSEEKALNVRAEALEKNLQPQKVSLSAAGAPIERPQFVFEKKDFKVDDIKINVRRPERS